VALNKADQIACRVNVVDRCTAAVVSYALYLLGTQTPTEGQLAWAREALREPRQWGDRLSWYVVGNANYISTGSSVTDSDIEYIVQTTINAQFIA
jgi:hypothetical protein